MTISLIPLLFLIASTICMMLLGNYMIAHNKGNRLIIALSNTQVVLALIALVHTIVTHDVITGLVGFLFTSFSIAFWAYMSDPRVLHLE